MVQPAERACFIERDAVFDELERDPAIDARVLGCEHHAHAAAAELVSEHEVTSEGRVWQVCLQQTSWTRSALY